MAAKAQVAKIAIHTKRLLKSALRTPSLAVPARFPAPVPALRRATPSAAPHRRHGFPAPTIRPRPLAWPRTPPPPPPGAPPQPSVEPDPALLPAHRFSFPP